MNRSTDECEISRSCHKATFSSAGVTALRTTRASRSKFSLSTGFALVRHRRAALLAGRKIFLGLEHFGALEVADFVASRSIEDATTPRVAKKGRMAVARDDLGRHLRQRRRLS